MKYVLGIDSGGTKYLVRAQTLEGKNITHFSGPSAAHHDMTMEQVCLRIRENIDTCLAKFGGVKENCAFLVCGTTGIDVPEDKPVIEKIYNGIEGFSCPIMCVNDTVVAQYAATGGIGALVIAGTGSIAYGRNSSGEEAQQGGWPPVIFGDEGSGTWIARKALAFLSEVYDGRRRECVLSREVEHKLGIKSGKELISICIEIENKRWADPGLAFVVDSAASLGNEDAVAIIKEASEKTSTLAIGVIEKLKLYNEKPFLVGTWGSALVKSPLYLEYFTRTLTEKYPDAQVVVSEKDAAEGACAIALAHLALDR